MALGGVRLHVWEAFWANLAPSWRPKRLRNRGQNAKKSMLKNNTFSRSIFGSPGHGFWEVFGWFFGPQIHAKSNLKKNIREPFCIVKTNTKSMSALLLQRLFEAKIDEKSFVSWNIAFGSVLEGFWEGFGRPKTLISHFFRHFFEANFKALFGRPKNQKKMPGLIFDGDFWTRTAERARPLAELEPSGNQRSTEKFHTPARLRRMRRIQTLRAFRRPHLGCLEPWSWEVSKNQGRILILKLPTPQKSSFGGVWEACLMNLGCLEQSWCALGVSEMRLGCVLERLESILEVSWGHLGASWGVLGGVLASLGGFLGAFWEYFMPFWAICENSTKPRENNNFSLIFWVSEGFGSLENENKSKK